MSNFKDKVAVITGGASGVGYAIGVALAKEGAKVVLSDIESSALESAKANFEKEGLSVDIKQADVSDHDSMVALNKFVTSEVGDVQMLFNNAGVAPAELQSIWDTNPNDWNWAYGVNVMGIVHGLQAFIPDMLSHGKEANVINTCSGNGAFINLPSTPIYISSKWNVLPATPFPSAITWKTVTASSLKSVDPSMK